MAVKKDFRVKLSTEVDDEGSFKETEAKAKGLGRHFETLIEAVRRLESTIASMGSVSTSAYTAASQASDTLTHSQAAAIDKYVQTNAQIKTLNASIAQTNAQVRAATATVAQFGDQITGAPEQNVVASSAETIKNRVASLLAVGGSLGVMYRLLAETDTAGQAAGKTFGTKLSPSILKTVEGAALLTPVLFYLGQTLKKTDSEAAQTTGTVLQLTSVLLGGFVFAVGAALTAVANLSIGIGESLMAQMTAYEKVAEKAERSTAAFTFTVVNFGEELGESAVGSLAFWNQQVTDLVDNTAYTVDSVRKSVKLLIADGTALGLTVQQNSRLLKIAGDVAANSGKELEEVTIALLSGIAGNSQAALALGIDLRDSALAHSKLAHETNLNMDSMSNLEKQQARLAVVFERTTPIIGSAANDLLTVAGAGQRLDATLQSLEARLGAQGNITRTILVLQQRLADAFLNLPDPIVRFIGTMQDAAGVVLKFGGIFLKYFFVVSTGLAVYRGLSVVLATSTTAQMALNLAFSLAPKAITAQIVPVVGLSTAYANLLVVTRAVTVAIGTEMIAALGKLGAILGRAALAVAPVILKFVLISAAVYSFVQAIKELFRDVDFLNDALYSARLAFDNTTDGIKGLTGKLGGFDEAMKACLNATKQVAKLFVSGLLTSVLMASRGIVYLSSLFADSDEESAQYSLQLEEIDRRLLTLSRTVNTALVDLASPFESAAIAAEAAADKTSKLNNNMAGFARTMDLLKNDLAFNPDDLRIEAIGTEFQKALVVARQAQTEMLIAQDRNINAAEKTKELEEEVLKTRLGASKAYLAVQKLQMDTMTKLTDAGKTANIEALKSQGKLVEVARLESAERLANFEKSVAGLKLLGGLTRSRIAEINKTRQALIQQADAQVKAAEADTVKKALEEQKKLRAELEQAMDRAYKKLDDLQKQAIDTEYENLKVNASERERIRLEYEKADVVAANLRAELESLGILDESTQAIIQRYRDAAKAKADLASEKLGIGSLTFPELGKSVADAASSGWQAFQGMLGAGGMEKAASSVAGGFKSAWESALTQIKRITLEDVGAALATVVSGTAQAAAALFSGQAVDEFAGVVEEFGNFPKALLEAFDRLGDVVTDLIRNLPAIIQKLIAAVPQIVDAFVKGFPKVIDMLIAALPQIAKTIADAIPKLLQSVLDALPKLIAAVPQMLRPLIAAIPGMITQIMEALPGIIQSLMEAIPQIIADIFKAIPAIVENFLDKLPQVVLALVDGISTALGDIAASFIDTFILRGGAERIIGSLIRAVPKLAIALVQGIVRGLAKSFQALGRVLGGGMKLPASIGELPEKIQDAASKLGQKIAKESSELFQVKDLESALKSTDQADRIGAAIAGATNTAVEKLRGAWDKLIQAWQWVYNTIIKPLGDMLYAVWTAAGQILTQAFGLLKTIWDAAISALTAVWGVIKAGWDAVIGALGAVWATIKAGWDQVIGVLGTVGSTIFNGFKSGLEGASSMFSSMGSKIWEGAKKGFDTLGQLVKDTLDKVNPQNLLQKMFKVDGGGTGTVEQALKIDVPWAKFAHGKVPGTAKVPGDSYANDTIMALVSPGEAIIPRSKMANPVIAELIKSVMDGTLDMPRFAFGLPQMPRLPEVPIGGVGQVVDLLSKLDPTSGLWTMVQNQVWEGLWNGIRHNSFAEGGIVGEAVPFVAGRSGSGGFPVEQFGMRPPVFTPPSNMRTSPMAGGTQVTYVVEKIEINARTNMTPESIRREIVPAVEKELRRKSQDGIRVIDPAGVRK